MSTSAGAVTVDGMLGAGEYDGVTVKSVLTNPAAPIGNFATPTNEATAGYDIYFGKSDENYLYALFRQTGGSAAGAFANIYLDMDATPGSDLGFEVTNKRAFKPGVAGYDDVAEIIFQSTGSAATNDLILEIGIPIAYLEGGIIDLPGLADETFQALSASSTDIVLRLSQTFGYSVAGGATYGDNRLGRVTIAADVPEPGTLSLLGLGLAGIAIARRRKRS